MFFCQLSVKLSKVMHQRNSKRANLWPERRLILQLNSKLLSICICLDVFKLIKTHQFLNFMDIIKWLPMVIFWNYNGFYSYFVLFILISMLFSRKNGFPSIWEILRIKARDWRVRPHFGYPIKKVAHPSDIYFYVFM